MPSKKTRKPTVRPTAASMAASRHVAFIPLIIVTCLIWFIYRALFSFPVWFDETVGKALFFGLPVWLYVTLSGSRSIPETFSLHKLRQGLLTGVAIGGLYGFAASILTLIQLKAQVQPVALFNSPDFWGEFFLALMTGFWETLFFFSWIMVIWQERFPKQSLLKQILAVSLIFVVFHLPNAFLRLPPLGAIRLIFLLFLFAIGQALVFSRWKNGYTLTLSQAIWGMVLLIHVG